MVVSIVRVGACQGCTARDTGFSLSLSRHISPPLYEREDRVKCISVVAFPRARTRTQACVYVHGDTPVVPPCLRRQVWFTCVSRGTCTRAALLPIDERSAGGKPLT